MNQQDFIRLEVKAKLLELKQDYFIADDEIIKALADITNDLRGHAKK